MTQFMFTLKHGIIKKLLSTLTILTLLIPHAVFADSVAQSQRMLNQLGYNAGPVDGAYGGKTKGALENFYANNGSTYDGKLDANEVRDLKSALKNFRPKNLPNHQRYKNVIRTSLRDLKVNKKMSLVEDFEKLMSYHKQNTIYKDDENSGPVEWYSNMINFQECVPDLSRTNTMKGSKSALNFGAFTNFCHNMIAHQFHINPTKNISHYKRIIDFWLENKTLENANSIQKAMGKESYNYAYALSTNVAKVMAHFSIYHPLYRYSDTQMQNIEKMFETFANIHLNFRLKQRDIKKVGTVELYIHFQKCDKPHLCKAFLRNSYVKWTSWLKMKIKTLSRNQTFNCFLVCHDLEVSTGNGQCPQCPHIQTDRFFFFTSTAIFIQEQHQCDLNSFSSFLLQRW